MSIIQIKDLQKSFGGVIAISDLSFQVDKGIVYSVIGPNGAGKTTLFNLLCGFYRPDQGEISFAGNHGDLSAHSDTSYQSYQLQQMTTDKIAACGISRTFQNLQIFFNMTALENVMVGCHLQSSCHFLQAMLRLPAVREEERKVRQQALHALTFCGLQSLAKETADSLPYGDLKRLEIARALASKPQMLLLDEPAAGLNDTETKEMRELIRRICDSGVTVLLVEHNMELVMNVSDQILVLNFGSLLAQGTAEQIRENPDVIRAYLGGEL